MFSDFDECLVRFSFYIEQSIIADPRSGIRFGCYCCIEQSIILTNRYTALLCQFDHLTHDLDFISSSLCSPSFSCHVFLNMRTFKDNITITVAQIVGVFYRM